MPDRNVGNIDLELLRVLACLLDTGSVTHTATRLGTTQSAVSKALARLRERFSDPLFVRRSRGLTPTPRALALADPLARALATMDALFADDEFDPASARLDVSVAATDYGVAVVLTPLIAALRRAAPGIRVHVQPLHRASLDQELADGRLDFALGGQDRAPPDLVSRLLLRDPFIAAVRADHPLVSDRLDLDLFCALDHALVNTGAGTPFSGRTDDALAALGRSRRVVASVTGFMALPPLLLGTDLIALAPERLLKRFGAGLKLLPPPIAVAPLPLSLLWHERTGSNHVHVWLRRLLTDLVGTMLAAEPDAA